MAIATHTATSHSMGWTPKLGGRNRGGGAAFDMIVSVDCGDGCARREDEDEEEDEEAISDLALRGFGMFGTDG